MNRKMLLWSDDYYGKFGSICHANIESAGGKKIGKFEIGNLKYGQSPRRRPGEWAIFRDMGVDLGVGFGVSDETYSLSFMFVVCSRFGCFMWSGL